MLKKKRDKLRQHNSILQRRTFQRNAWADVFFPSKLRKLRVTWERTELSCQWKLRWHPGIRLQ